VLERRPQQLLAYCTLLLLLAVLLSVHQLLAVGRRLLQRVLVEG
jgi:hypothetical protein